VLACLTFIFLSVVVFKVVYKKYQQHKKLIPLLVDYDEYEEDLEEEIKEKLQK
jgi:hypothetical protein